MSYQYIDVQHFVHRLIPSRFPPISLFDWAKTQEEVEAIAAIEGLTNERLLSEHGNICLVRNEDWVGGKGSTPLMSAFTHPGPSRFSNGTYGVYYAAESIETAIAETKYHREQFLAASDEPACRIQMREYKASLKKQLIDICHKDYALYLNPEPRQYSLSQSFGDDVRNQKEWGIYYTSVRRKKGACVAIFRPPALTLPVQVGHYDYVWDGEAISEVRISKPM